MMPLLVRSEVFLREDVESILKAIDAANRHSAAQSSDPQAEVFRAGFHAALEVVAEALHSSLDDGAASVARRLQLVALPERRGAGRVDR